MNIQPTLSGISLSEFRKNPFCGYNIIDGLMRAGCTTLADAVKFTEDEAMAIRGFGKEKAAQFLAFRDLLINNPAKVIDHYDHHIRTAVISSSGSDSMSVRISSMLDRLCSCLQREGANDLALICSEHLMKNRTITEIADDKSLGFNITRERLRQKAVYLKNSIWANDLSKFRVIIDESFLDDLAFTRCKCAGKTVNHLLSSISDKGGHGYTNLLRFTTVRSNLYPAILLSEDYVIPSELGVHDFIEDMNAVIEQLHADVRPSSLQSITSRASKNRATLNEEKVAFLLSSNNYCEKVNNLWQIRYKNLCDFEKAARIVWEKKSINYMDVDMYHAIKTGEDRQISGNLGIAKNKFSWCQPIGRTGTWEYREDEKSRDDIASVIRDYVISHEVFRFSDAVAYLRSLGFRYPDKTVRAYFMNECRTAIADTDLLVAERKVDDHREISWRKKHAPVPFNWAMSVIADYVAKKGPSKPCDLSKAIAASDNGGYLTYRSAEYFIYNTLRISNALCRDDNGLVSVNPSFVPSDAELPSHYQAVISAVKSKVMQSPTGMCSLRSLKDACKNIIAPFASTTIFYKIMADHCPEGIMKVYVDGKVYLRLVA